MGQLWVRSWIQLGESCPGLMCNILQGTGFLHYLLCKACCCELLLLRDKPWATQGKMQLLAWSSAFCSGELSGTRKQLSAGLVPITACKGRRWMCRKRAGTGFLLPEEGKNLHQWVVLHALAGNTAALKVLSQLAHPWQKWKPQFASTVGKELVGCAVSQPTSLCTLVSKVGCACAAESKCCVPGKESKHLLMGKDTQSHGWNISLLHQEMMAALTSPLMMIFFTAEFCPVSLADATQPFRKKKVHWPFLLFLPCGFDFYQVEI